MLTAVPSSLRAKHWYTPSSSDVGDLMIMLPPGGVIITLDWSLPMSNTSPSFFQMYLHITTDRRGIIIRPPVTVVREVLYFARDVFFSFARFPPPSVDRSPWNFATWSETGSIIFSPKIRLSKMGGQKHAKFRSIFYHFWLWSRISPERGKISKIGKTCDLERFLPRSTKRSGELWSTIPTENSTWVWTH